jgi:hypothetical protein
MSFPGQPRPLPRHGALVLPSEPNVVRPTDILVIEDNAILREA